MATPLKPSEEYMYNWTNRSVLDFAKAIAPEPSETKALVNVTTAVNMPLTTVANKTIFKLVTPLGDPNVANISLTNLGAQQIGDQLILIATINSGPNGTLLNFDNSFYLTRAGSIVTYLNFYSNETYRLVITFTYDGTKFVATTDFG
jgi:hypothetical protein